jgi:tRNA/rRNA methyltransferase
MLDAATLYATTREAVADLNLVYATTARERGQMKRVLAPEKALATIHERIGSGEKVGILFGRERTGLENDEISLADAVITFPVNPAFASVNLAQAVLLVGYEWARASAAPLRFEGGLRSPPAPRAMLISFFDYIEAELDAVNFYPPDKRPVMTRNLRDIFHRLALTEQDVRTLRGAIRALIEARRLRKP